MPKAGGSRPRFGLAVPADGDLEAEAGRLVALGATRAAAASPGEANHREANHREANPGEANHREGGAGDRGGAGALVLADPDGNEFRVLGPR